MTHNTKNTVTTRARFKYFKNTWKHGKNARNIKMCQTKVNVNNAHKRTTCTHGHAIAFEDCLQRSQREDSRYGVF